MSERFWKPPVGEPVRLQILRPSARAEKVRTRDGYYWVRRDKYEAVMRCESPCHICEMFAQAIRNALIDRYAV